MKKKNKLKIKLNYHIYTMYLVLVSTQEVTLT